MRRRNNQPDWAGRFIATFRGGEWFVLFPSNEEAEEGRKEMQAASTGLLVVFPASENLYGVKVAG